ncbi:E3 ubiquitin-protein ligase BRE1 [Apiospora arundinis]
MEDRKRPAMSGADDIGPPTKRQAVNGSSKHAKDDSDMKEEAWIEEYTKDAILRQMLEYKRKCSTLETRLEDMEQRSAYHDDHLRTVDSWWIQLLQEVSVLAENKVPFQAGEEQPFPTHTSFKDIEGLQAHLDDKAAAIKTITDSLFSRLSAARGEIAPNITNLEAQVNTLLANQKDFLVKLESYLKAERKLDRVKSVQVQKLEQQAMASATARPSGADAENGDSGESNGNAQALKLALEEAKVEATKQKEQLEAIQTQNKTIQEELTNLQIRLTNLTDEDYSRTDLFKLLKNQHEELVKKANHLDTENKKLQEVSHKLKVERETYKKKLEEEAQTLTTELEDQLQQSDTALARVRSARDELHGEVTMLKSQRDQERQAANHLKELVAANQDRITALESELQRLQPSEDVDMTPRPDIEEMGLEDLREKYKKWRRTSSRSMTSCLP